MDSVHTLPSIPSSIRPQVASLMSEVSNEAVAAGASGDISAWVRYLLLPKAILRCWPSGDPRYKLGQRKRRKAERDDIFHSIQAWRAGGDSRDKLIRDLLRASRPPPRPPPSNDQLKKLCLKLGREYGQFAKALQALFSLGVADSNDETTRVLRDKHPVAPPLASLSEFNLPAEVEPFRANSDQVFQAISSFPRGSACGRSSLRASHLTQLEASYKDFFLDSLTKMVNAVAAGQAPPSIAPFLASAPLTPLKKKDGSIRPVAVGEVLRRIVSKLAMKHVCVEASELLQPLQMAIGVRHGTEAILHSLNRAIRAENLSPYSVLALVDFDNAFNAVSCKAFMEAGVKYFPSIAH